MFFLKVAALWNVKNKKQQILTNRAVEPAQFIIIYVQLSNEKKERNIQTKQHQSFLKEKLESLKLRSKIVNNN